ncbi:MAG: hypothetical protein QXS54_12270 [Candidatus Methanomethylicaceae archaeon]
MDKKAIPMLLCAILLISFTLIACNLLQIPRSFVTYQCGPITIKCPNGWHVLCSHGGVYISPQPIPSCIVEDLSYPEEWNQPFLGVAVWPLEDIAMAWPEYDGSPESVLEMIAISADANLTSQVRTLELGSITWTIADFMGAFGDFQGDLQGQIAVTINSNYVVLALSVAPKKLWSEYKDDFEAILRSLTIAGVSQE